MSRHLILTTGVVAILLMVTITLAVSLSGCQYLGCRLAFGGHQQCAYLLTVCDAERPCDEQVYRCKQEGKCRSE